MTTHRQSSLAHDFFLPTVLFAALGGMTWAVRGSSGYGASAGCIFAGVTLGAAWWFIARDPSGTQTRPYSSGWIILAMTVAFGIAGNRGWMQWPSFFDHRLYTDYRTGQFEPIERAYGFLWLFLAGIPWAGLGACMIAWSGSAKRTSPLLWVLRLACGIGMAWFLGWFLYDRYPEVFLPHYDLLKDKYQDLATYGSLKKLVRDNHEGMYSMGLYLGFLGFELLRREWKNVLLILTVGLLNGIGWSLLQNWTWAAHLWPEAKFNFWRCWETSGGISIGISYGVAYYLVNRRLSESDIAARQARHSEGQPTLAWLTAYLISAAIIGYVSYEVMPAWSQVLFTVAVMAFGIHFYSMSLEASAEQRPRWSIYGPILERWGAYLGLVFGLGLSIKNGLKGWANIYLGNEGYWNVVFWYAVAALMWYVLVVLAFSILTRERNMKAGGDAFPHAYKFVWLVLIVQNVLAQIITGPPSAWEEVVFNLYYILLFFISAVVIHHYHCVKQCEEPRVERDVLALQPYEVGPVALEASDETDVPVPKESWT